MVDPLFWLGLSLLLVAVSLTAVLVVALPALQELARAARSAEKLFDTLNRELPPTLESIRLTGLEITELTDDVSEGVQNANRVVQQLDQSVTGVRQQAKQAQITTQSVFAGVKAAWKTFTRPTPPPRRSKAAKALPPKPPLLSADSSLIDPALGDPSATPQAESRNGNPANLVQPELETVARTSLPPETPRPDPLLERSLPEDPQPRPDPSRLNPFRLDSFRSDSFRFNQMGNRAQRDGRRDR